MAFLHAQHEHIKQALANYNVTLVAVSKTKSVADILEAYHAGIRDFGENYVQELCDKQHQLPKDIRWHFIGHLQSNKVKYIAPFIHLIHGVDSEKLLLEIQKQGLKNNQTIQCLLQVHIAKEDTKFGFNLEETFKITQQYALHQHLSHVCIRGLMGMASNTDNLEQIKNEFTQLKNGFDTARSMMPTNLAFNCLSMGMSSDYLIAVQSGSTMVRIGSLLFGHR